MKRPQSLLRRFSQRHRRGTGTVEFGFIFPLLILLTMSIFEFGRGIWIWHSMQEALNITGRYAMYNPLATNSQLQNYFGQNIQAVPSSAVNMDFSNSIMGTTVFTTLTATYNFVPITNIIPSLSFVLTSTIRVPRT